MIKLIMPTWCLELVLAALTKAPFDPIETWKTVFLLVITSVCRASELHALCIRFSSGGVTLFTRLEFLPNVYTKANTGSASTGHSMRTRDVLVTTGSTALPSSLLPMADKSGENPSPSRDSNCWSNLSSLLKYYKHDLPTPEWVKGHQTCKMAVTYTDMAGAEPQIIFEATWQNTNTFARFYRVEIVVVNSGAEFVRRVLMLAGSSTPAPHRWDGYDIPRKKTFLTIEERTPVLALSLVG